MSRRQKIKHMTAEELKTKLYAHFQRTGSLDHLRAQLRGQLVSELFKVAEPVDSDAFPNATDVDKCLLPLQVSNWLVFDHLTRQDYQYSLSTFVTEAHLPHPDKFLTAGDVLVLLGVGHKSSEFKKISRLYTESNELGCLHSLLLAIIKILFNLPSKDSVLNQSHNPNSEVKLQENGIHQEELAHSSRQTKHQTLNYASVLNDSVKSNSFRVEENFLPNDELKSPEASFHEQLQSIKEKNEKEVQKLRHKLLEELDKLHSQERKMQLEIEFTKSELRKEQNKLLKEKEMLKEKELLLGKETAHKFELKMRDVEADFASKLHFKEKEIEALKMKVSEKEQKLMRTETELSSEKDSQGILKRELEDMKHMYKIIQDKYSSVLDENTNLLKKFENMSDYSVLKEELSMKSKDTLRLQQEIKNIHQQSEAERRKYVETVRSLEDNLNMKEPQLKQAQQELEHVRSTFSAEEALWKKERKKFEQELSEFKDFYGTVIERMENQKEDIQDLHRTIHTLNYKLTNNSSVMRNKSFVPSKNFQGIAGTSTSGRQESLFTKRSTIPLQSLEKYEDVSLQFLTDAKSRLGKLRQEEDLVQEKYSFIYSSLPENNKQTESSYFNLVSIPKSSVDNYSFKTFSKPNLVPSVLNFENFSRNKIMSNLKSPYSLADVKRMVSHSLFSNKSKDPENFQVNIGDFDHAPMFSNVINDGFKDISKEPKEYLDLHMKSPGFSHSETDASKGSTRNHNRSLFEINDRMSDELQKTYSVSKNINQDVRKASHREHNDSGEKDNDSNEFLQKIQTSSDVAENNEFENSNVSARINENVVPLQTEGNEKISETQEFGFTIQNKVNTLQEKSLNLVYESNQETQSIVSEKSKPKTESTSGVFVNLDAAWKKISSTSPEISQISQRVSNVQDESLLESVPTNKTIFCAKQDASGTNVDNFIEEANKAGDKSKEPPTIQDAHVSHFTETTNKTDSELKEQPIFKSAGSPSTADDETATQNKNSSLTTNEEEKDNIPVKSKADSVNSSELNSNQSNSKCDHKNDNINTNEKDVKSVEKIENADTLSELSEIQLSCGSEPEQQKDDSDAW